MRRRNHHTMMASFFAASKYLLTSCQSISLKKASTYSAPEVDDIDSSLSPHDVKNKKGIKEKQQGIPEKLSIPQQCGSYQSGQKFGGRRYSGMG